MLLVFIRGKRMGARHARAIILPQSFDMPEMLAGEFEYLALLHAEGFPFTKQTPNGTARAPDRSIDPALSLEPAPVRQAFEAFAHFVAQPAK